MRLLKTSYGPAMYVALKVTLYLCAQGHTGGTGSASRHRARALEETGELPDGNTITDCAEPLYDVRALMWLTFFHVTGERMSCAEVLFQPEFIGKVASGTHSFFLSYGICTQKKKHRHHSPQERGKREAKAKGQNWMFPPLRKG